MLVSDSHYSYGTIKPNSEIKDQYKVIIDTVPIGKTFSILIPA